MIFGGVAGCLGWVQRSGAFFMGSGAGKASREMQAAASGIRPMLRESHMSRVSTPWKRGDSEVATGRERGILDLL